VHAINLYFYVYVEIVGVPYSPLTLTEAVWWGLFIVTHHLMTLVMLFACIFAYRNPKLLVNHNWQFKFHRVHEFFSKINLSIFTLVIFVDFFQILWTTADISFRQSQPDAKMEDNERFLNIIVRILQGFFALIFFCIISYLLKMRKDRKLKEQEAQKLLKKFDSIPIQTFQENQEGDLEMKTQATECPICLSDFSNEDVVLQLQCHRNHIFHRACIRQFIEKTSSNMQDLNCPLCKQTIHLD
jgi:hypothetical protein